MSAPDPCRRAVAALAVVSLCLLLAARPLRLAAGGDEEPLRFVERQADAAGGGKGSRLLPTLVGLAVAGGVVAVLVLTVFRGKGYNPHIIPLEFVEQVDQPLFPLPVGRSMTYVVESAAGTEALTVEATAETRLIMGILCRGVHERVIADGRLSRDSWRWYAQHEDGSVWFFAGETKEYDYAETIADWSWQAGLDGAKPGVALPADAAQRLGREYWQAYAPGTLEEKAVVVGLSESASVPLGAFSGCLKIKVTSSREPGTFEYRYYAPQVGLVLCEPGRLGGRRIALASITSN